MRKKPQVMTKVASWCHIEMTFYSGFSRVRNFYEIMLEMTYENL